MVIKVHALTTAMGSGNNVKTDYITATSETATKLSNMSNQTLYFYIALYTYGNESKNNFAQLHLANYTLKTFLKLHNPYISTVLQPYN